ncbi:hypothetical protein AAHH80_34735, partial [Burkholderia pseudomallei]
WLFVFGLRDEVQFGLYVDFDVRLVVGLMQGVERTGNIVSVLEFMLRERRYMIDIVVLEGYAFLKDMIKGFGLGF